MLPRTTSIVLKLQFSLYLYPIVCLFALPSFWVFNPQGPKALAQDFAPSSQKWYVGLIKMLLLGKKPQIRAVLGWFNRESCASWLSELKLNHNSAFWAWAVPLKSQGGNHWPYLLLPPCFKSDGDIYKVTLIETATDSSNWYMFLIFGFKCKLTDSFSEFWVTYLP